MKRVSYFLFLTLLLLGACKKTTVDSTSLKTFQNSINDLESSLSTIQQTKFNEALYILKKFGVEGNDDISELKGLSKLLNGKKVPEIFAMADKVAQTNNIDWSSTGPPSLGEMNIFGTENATEKDPNQIDAASLSLTTTPIAVDSIVGAKALQIIPRLLDNSGKPISFDGAGLETILEVSSNGTRLLTSKNLMQNNNFKGFTLKFASLPKDKITDDKIEIKVSVKTSKKTYQMIKSGVLVNSKALSIPMVKNPTTEVADSLNTNVTDPNATPVIPDTPKVTAENPKTAVSKFLNNIGSQNLKGAYDASNNPSWGNYEQFANPNSGFGSVKNLNVNNISTKNITDNSASVDAAYNVTDKNGNTVALDVTYGLKNTNGTWKITSYKINSSQKK